MKPRYLHGLFAIVALVIATLVVRYYNEQPGYTDAYYHYNAAVHVAQGDGFVDDYLWTYIGAPSSLPSPSHLYWMPGTTMIASMGMRVFGVQFASAQIGLVACLWGASLLTYWLGLRVKGYRRHAWCSGLMLLFGGFYMRVWGTTDTFAPYAFFGAGALVCMGLGASSEKRQRVYWALAGAMSAFGHLIRSDGLLLVVVGVCVIISLGKQSSKTRWQWLAIFVLAYVLVMAPWFIRNLTVIGSPLPVGGTQAIWYTTYDDLFNYPPDANPQTFFADGLGLFLRSRWEAFVGNFQNLIAVEGFVILLPFMWVALWERRKDRFWRGVGMFIIGVHGAFTILFPFPGTRGGLFHASSALMPFWVVLALVGVDNTITWIAKYRRNWQPRTAQPIFSLGVLCLVVWLSWSSGLGRRELVRMPDVYVQFMKTFPPGARVMRNDPAELYYYTGIGGVVLPNESPTVIQDIATQYDIDYVIFEYPNLPEPLQEANFPSFLVPVPFDVGGVKIYAIDHP